MSIELNKIFTMLEAINELPRPKTFLRNRLFGGRERLVPQLSFKYDAIQGKKVLAPYVNPKTGFKMLDRADMITRTFDFPLVAPADAIDEDMAMQRMAGEMITGGLTPAQRQTQDEMMRIAIFDDAITRLEEAQIGQALVSGIIPIVGEGVNDSLSYITLGWAGPSDITDGTKDWDAATPDPTILADIRAWKNEIMANSGFMPDTLILGDSAAAVFLEDTAVQAALNRLNVNVGSIQYSDVDGAEFLGRIFGVDVFAHTDGYYNGSATVPFIDAQYAVMCCSASRIAMQTMAYGPYHDVVTKQTYLQSRVYIPGDGDRLENVTKWKLASRPIPYLPFMASWKSIRVID